MKLKSISAINNARNKLKRIEELRGEICSSRSFPAKSQQSRQASKRDSREGLKLINKQIANAKCWQHLMCIIIILRDSYWEDDVEKEGGEEVEEGKKWQIQIVFIPFKEFTLGINLILFKFKAFGMTGEGCVERDATRDLKRATTGDCMTTATVRR